MSPDDKQESVMDALEECDLDTDAECSVCGGEGYVECDDALCCHTRHLKGSDYELCGACGGSGLAKDQTYW